MTQSSAPAHVTDEAHDLVRLEALENLAASKLTAAQATELARLHAQYGSIYERRLTVALERFEQILNSPRFDQYRAVTGLPELAQQVEQLGDYRLPERAGTITPDQSRQMRCDLANRLTTVSAIRRHALRNANVLDAQADLAYDLWRGLTPADCEWRVKGGIAEALAPLKDKALQAQVVADAADSVFWNIKALQETLSRMMEDYDRTYNKDATEREARKHNTDDRHDL